MSTRPSFSPNTRIKSAEANLIWASDWATWTPTTTGWSGTPNVLARFSRLGNNISIWLGISGTSNTTSVIVSLPAAPSFGNGTGGALNVGVPLGRAADNGSYLTTGLPFADFIDGDANVSCYTTGAGGAWTAANSKTIFLICTYPAA